MARTRHRKDSTKNAPKTHLEKLQELSRRGIHVDPTDTRAVARKYGRIPLHLERPAPADVRQKLKRHGFRTTDRGVIVDGPRDSRRKRIRGSRLEILKSGVIKTSVKQRRDFVYGFTPAEKKQFALDPGAFEIKKLAELKRFLPSLAKARKPQVRLQWGAYQATKDFAPTYFSAKYFATISPEEIRKVGKRKAQPRIDKLTGLHIVIHVPTTAGKRKRAKNKSGKRK